MCIKLTHFKLIISNAPLRIHCHGHVQSVLDCFYHYVSTVETKTGFILKFLTVNMVNTMLSDDRLFQYGAAVFVEDYGSMWPASFSSPNLTRL